VKFKNYLSTLETRSLNLVSGGLLLLIIALIITNGLVPEIKEYQSVVKAKTLLERNTVHHSNLDNKIKLQKLSVEQLKKSIHGEMMDVPDQYIESYVIGLLQKISWANKVDIGSIQPVPWRTMKTYRELVFEVEFSGDYFDLYRLINNMASEMGFIVIKNMEIVSQVEKPKILVMKMTIASYRAKG